MTIIPAFCHKCLRADADQHEVYAQEMQERGNWQGAHREFTEATRLRDAAKKCPNRSCDFHRRSRRRHLQVVGEGQESINAGRHSFDASADPSPRSSFEIPDVPICATCWKPIVRVGLVDWEHVQPDKSHPARTVEEAMA